MKTKFITYLTEDGNKTFNVSNVALIENKNGKTQITLNIKQESDTNVSFSINQSWDKVASEIESLTLD
ncbi:hypothetical protein BWZ22_13510 [Seonamhaeicola sp. S2-3]|uniref:hypothetical protein n=1 Tax=Seonamhaeicola sp. S2-3 TaxID=1936081 RepID=UPI0009728453|nr:hypothetical protein [Seonamhaeicola sp. S2-3]APY12169.1 hypothetical protein BWZ22_13460 [Seonamhaeicola sp. S2-3]APY12172.1 hypothetical protein BWZ22_13475 [Seonamhaeicola sp. S2-3]APY12179.1 hypothetical protein BWZ22_13510 [Seonamhaeicola sp. S2-3]